MPLLEISAITSPMKINFFRIPTKKKILINHPHPKFQTPKNLSSHKSNVKNLMQSSMKTMAMNLYNPKPTEPAKPNKETQT